MKTKQETKQAGERDQQAHKGYIIGHNQISGFTWIEKGGFNIGTAKDIADARHIIDTVLT